MSKRRLNRSHIRVQTPKPTFPLPEDLKRHFSLVEKMGRERAQSIIEDRNLICEQDFAEERLIFRENAQENEGFFQLLLTVFLLRIFTDLKEHTRTKHEKKKVVNPEESKNQYLISALSQRTFALACLHLNDEAVNKLRSLSEYLNFSQIHWEMQFSGAVTIARVIRSLLNEHADIRFPTLEEYLDWKIDLIVSFARRTDGLCLQVKCDQRIPNMDYRRFDHENALSVQSDDVRFMQGVRQFQKTFRGIWIPLEISLGFEPFQSGTVSPQKPLARAIHNMLNANLDEHTVPTVFA